jgi:predicted DNA-binding ribbon-helix-helix protein
VSITLDQLRTELGLSRAEWRELQYAAVDREMSTRDLVQSVVRAAVEQFSSTVCRQSQSTRSTARKA